MGCSSSNANDAQAAQHLEWQEKNKNTIKDNAVQEVKSSPITTNEFDDKPVTTEMLREMSVPSELNSKQESPAPILAAPQSRSTASRSPMQAPPMLQGFLSKQGRGAIKTWKNRYFVLRAGKLSYFEFPQSDPPFGYNLKGSLSLDQYSIGPVPENLKVPAAFAAFTIYLSTNVPTVAAGGGDASVSKESDTPGDPTLSSSSSINEQPRGSAGAASTEQQQQQHPLLLSCDSEELRSSWVAALEAHIEFRRMHAESLKGGSPAPASGSVV